MLHASAALSTKAARCGRAGALAMRRTGGGASGDKSSAKVDGIGCDADDFTPSFDYIVGILGDRTQTPFRTGKSRTCSVFSILCRT